MPSTEPRSIRALLAAALLAGLLLAACGSDDDDGATAPDDPVTDPAPDDGDTSESDDGDSDDGEAASGTNACDVLTDEDIAEAVGEAPAEQERSEGTPGSYESCEWFLPAAEDSQSVGLPPHVGLVLMDADGYSDRMEPAGDLYQPLDGLGDEAGWHFTGMEQTGYSVQLLARQGDAALHLIGGGLSISDEEAAKQAFTTLAERAFERR